MLNSPKTSDMMVDDVEFATPRTRGKKSLRVNNNISDFLIKSMIFLKTNTFFFFFFFFLIYLFIYRHQEVC